MYALINDIERYPEFVPWCTAARVDARKEHEAGFESFLDEIVISRPAVFGNEARGFFLVLLAHGRDSTRAGGA